MINKSGGGEDVRFSAPGRRKRNRKWLSLSRRNAEADTFPPPPPPPPPTPPPTPPPPPPAPPIFGVLPIELLAFCGFVWISSICTGRDGGGRGGGAGNPLRGLIQSSRILIDFGAATGRRETNKKSNGEKKTRDEKSSGRGQGAPRTGHERKERERTKGGRTRERERM